MEAHNRTEHSSLIGRAPYQVHWDDDVKFNLRCKAAQDLQHNSDLIERRGQKLVQEGGFRNEEPIKNKFERAFTPHYEGKAHAVAKVLGPTVYDEEGRGYPTRHVLPVERSSEAVNTTNLQGGSARIDRVRLEKLEPHRAAITAFVGAGKTENEVVRYMKTLGMDQLTNAGFNFRNMLKLLGFSTGEGRGSSTAMVRNLAAPQPPPAPVRRRIVGKQPPPQPVRRRIVGKQPPT